MSNPPSCDFLPVNTFTVDQAQIRILQTIKPIKESETLELTQALGRVLAQAIIAPFDVPPYRNSAMDGYAVKSQGQTQGLQQFRMIGKSFAGHPYQGSVGAGECVRIMTGAVVPEGADAVLMQEEVIVQGELIEYQGSVRLKQHIRHPGEDLAQGSEVLASGRVLNAADLGLIASLGIGQVTVWRKPKVAIISTGDELKPIGQTLNAGQIYDSNRYTLRGLLQRLAVEVLDIGIVPDDPELLEATFKSALQQADVLISSGGVSVGEADYVTRLLEQLGQIDFWKIAMKPGKPLAFGRLGECAFFGLPGNPVSTMVTFLVLVRPALLTLGHYPVKPLAMTQAKLLSPVRKAVGRQDYQRGICHQDDTGQWWVQSTGLQESHVLRSMSLANCFIVLAREWSNIEEGAEVPIVLFEGLF
ncbi:gephyrin-like molybdotransferase Glp [Thiofilum flexile]|uniref:molybdopterin molybdotransferase MoeA n=1 Tax=Thiofilum flexile TaxID=125627 RepID=UPI00037756A4|nr:gephyrin-like molybdotransferase Glp [Thiofilum flexile]